MGNEIGMSKLFRSGKEEIVAYLWRRWDMFCLGLNPKAEKALVMAEFENDEYKYNYIWFRAIMPEGSAWWHT